MGYDWFDTEVKPKLFPVIIHSIRVWISDLYNICPQIAKTETQKLSPDWGPAQEVWLSQTGAAVTDPRPRHYRHQAAITILHSLNLIIIQSYSLDQTSITGPGHHSLVLSQT